MLHQHKPVPQGALELYTRRPPVGKLEKDTEKQGIQINHDIDLLEKDYLSSAHL